MKRKLRNGTLIDQQDGQDRLLALLYGHLLGRLIIKPLTAPALSNLAGRFLSSRASCILIKPFIRKNRIDMSQFVSQNYRSYNEFFSRKIRTDARPIDQNPNHLISPCDSKLTVLPIHSDTCFTLKHTRYSVRSLLRNAALASEYANGYALIFRLTVDDYHRYCYVADGKKTKNIHIPGVLHTVNPIANDYFPVYKENAREYSILRSEEFGDILMMEVGALFVGKIINHHGKCKVSRGQEKGYFQFGGSTVVLLLKENMVQIDEDILENSYAGIETVVKYGEKIGNS
ncbi:MAG: phosphatidylserine decarboxylase [Brotaphodocola sp.]